MALRGWISALLVAMVSALPVVRAACDASCAAIAVPAPASTATDHCPSHPGPVPEHAHDDGRITVGSTAAPIGHAIHAWVPVGAAVGRDSSVARLGIVPPLTPVPSHRLQFIPLRI
jgi:hypothetical protein